MSQREEKLNPAQQAELDRLVAEQEADDTDFESPRGAVSLDAPLGGDEDSRTLHDLAELKAVGASPTASLPKQSYKITPEQVREWRRLRNKEKWTYQAIADYAGVQVQTVRRHLSQRDGTRLGVPSVNLMERLGGLRAAYEAGASLREIAEVHYEEFGYRTWQSCYQQLRVAFIKTGVVLRQRTPKHGMRSTDAPAWVRRKYQRERARARNAARLTRCDAVIRSGRPCRRWAIRGSRYCMVHDEQTHNPASERKWTKQNVIEALRVWAAEYGEPPKSHDWAKAEDGHPSFRTVVDLFGKWNYALYEAGLRKRKHPKKRIEGRQARLNKGYKPCDREGCENTVPPTWRYCRDRRCQDARTQAQFNGLGS